MFAAAELYDVVEKLSDERKNVIYRLALDMLCAQQTEEFDNYTPEDIKMIQDAQKRIANGDCLSFSSADEMIAYFEKID